MCMHNIISIQYIIQDRVSVYNHLCCTKVSSRSKIVLCRIGYSKLQYRCNCLFYICIMFIDNIFNTVPEQQGKPSFVNMTLMQNALVSVWEEEINPSTGRPYCQL